MCRLCIIKVVRTSIKYYTMYLCARAVLITFTENTHARTQTHTPTNPPTHNTHNTHTNTRCSLHLQMLVEHCRIFVTLHATNATCDIRL